MRLLCPNSFRTFLTFSPPSLLLRKRKEPTHTNRFFSVGSGSVLLSRAVSSQVPSALKGLTSVFGMGTGGSPSPLPPEFLGSVLRFALAWLRFHTLKTAHPAFQHLASLSTNLFFTCWPRSSQIFKILGSSPRPISIIKLHPLPDFHR